LKLVAIHGSRKSATHGSPVARATPAAARCALSGGDELRMASMPPAAMRSRATRAARADQPTYESGSRNHSESGRNSEKPALERRPSVRAPRPRRSNVASALPPLTRSTSVSAGTRSRSDSSRTQ
jgi:hypothetical protein